MQPTLSAVVVPMPEAEPRVRALRAELDPAAMLGVPAHVTIMFPFLPPPEIDDEVLSALRAITAAAPAFDVRFARVEWFGEDVVWLAPQPAEPFVALSAAVTEHFDEGAQGDGVVPHLTVGHDAPLPRLRAAAAQVAAGPPVRATVRSAWLMTGSREPGSWTSVADLPLAGG
jgi:2'-5' RNA ligase